MSTITGKIYQQMNAAGTENRFPRTVVEAVLGLSSYLQQQFSSLSSIYLSLSGGTISGSLGITGNSEIGGSLNVGGELTVPQYAGLNFEGAQLQRRPTYRILRGG